MAKEEKKEPVETDTVVKLKFPVEYAGETIDEVVIKPLRGRHIKGMSSEPSIDDLLRIASRASGLSEKVFDLMSSKDILRVVQAVGEAL